MKTLPLISAVVLACVSGFAQGQLNFANFGAGANAPVYLWDGTKLAGAAWSADLYWAAGTVVDSTVLTALGQPATFASSGYFLGGSRTIAGQTVTITGQVRVWDTASGSSWAAAIASGLPNTAVGESVLSNHINGATDDSELVDRPEFVPRWDTGTLNARLGGLGACGNAYAASQIKAIPLSVSGNKTIISIP